MQTENLKSTSESVVRRRLDIARLILALVCTPAVLIYAWGRVLVIGMLRGRPEALYILLLIAGIAGVVALTAGLSARFRSERIDRFVIVGVPILWVAVTTVLIWLRFGDTVPKFVAGPLFLLATLWVLWAAWMFYRPWTWRLRIGGLVALLPFAAVVPLLLRFHGLTRETPPDFGPPHVAAVRR